MAAPSTPFRALTIRVVNSTVIVQPAAESESVSALVLKADGSVSPGTVYAESPTDDTISAHGILGVVRLLGGSYLLYISAVSEVGVIEGKSLYKVEGTEVLGLDGGEPDDKDKSYLRMVKNVANSGWLYTSYDYDLTLSCQRIVELKPESRSASLHDRADGRFFWNHSMVTGLLEHTSLHPYVLPVMMGFVQFEKCSINKVDFEFAIISRRNHRRAGTRYHTRGIDEQGEVANNCETEQIVLVAGDEPWLMSYVQTRGSAPVFFEQKGMQYKPRPNLTKPALETASAFGAHFSRQVEIYGRQILVNLLEGEGAEAVVGVEYEKQVKMKNDGNLKYVAFDFHEHCSGMRFGNVINLLEATVEDVLDLGYLVKQKNGFLRGRQSGVVRTNCLDCLDRTNVVQATFAKFILSLQLKRVGILKSNDNLDSHEIFSSIFKHLWANNGDAISIQYVGTGALKNDFTRTGKRTVKGALNDGVNSMRRYVLNNFRDDYRQDAYDLFLGKYDVKCAPPRSKNRGDGEVNWFDEQMRAIDICAKRLLKDGQEFLRGWVVVSINRYNREQERILISTKQGFYRAKFNFLKCEVVSWKYQKYCGVKSVRKGNFSLTSSVHAGDLHHEAAERKHFGCRVYVSKVEFRTYKPLLPQHAPRELEEALVDEICETLLQGKSQFGEGTDIEMHSDDDIKSIRPLIKHAQKTAKRIRSGSQKLVAKRDIDFKEVPLSGQSSQGQEGSSNRRPSCITGIENMGDAMDWVGSMENSGRDRRTSSFQFEDYNNDSGSDIDDIGGVASSDDEAEPSGADALSGSIGGSFHSGIRFDTLELSEKPQVPGEQEDTVPELKSDKTATVVEVNKVLMQGIEKCQALVDKEKEIFLGAFVMTVTDKWDVDRLRVIVIASEGFYRAKYDFVAQRVVKFKVVRWRDVVDVHEGTVGSRRMPVSVLWTGNVQSRREAGVVVSTGTDSRTYRAVDTSRMTLSMARSLGFARLPKASAGMSGNPHHVKRVSLLGESAHFDDSESGTKAALTTMLKAWKLHKAQ